MCKSNVEGTETEINEMFDEVPYDDIWEVHRENVRLLGKIGEGAFGRVLKAKAYIPRLGSTWLTVAVKTLKKYGSKIIALQQFYMIRDFPACTIHPLLRKTHRV